MVKYNRVLKVNKRSRSVRPKDPLYEFRKSSRREMGKYDLPGEIWKIALKLVYTALALAAVWFVFECWRAWNIFQ